MKKEYKKWCGKFKVLLFSMTHFCFRNIIMKTASCIRRKKKVEEANIKVFRRTKKQINCRILQWFQKFQICSTKYFTFLCSILISDRWLKCRIYAMWGSKKEWRTLFPSSLSPKKSKSSRNDKLMLLLKDYLSKKLTGVRLINQSLENPSANKKKFSCDTHHFWYNSYHRTFTKTGKPGNLWCSRLKTIFLSFVLTTVTR